MKPDLKRAYKTFPLRKQVPYEQFRSVVTMTLKRLIEEVVDGHQVRTPIGTFRISAKQRDYNKPVLSMPASLRYRQQLVDQGITPLKGDNGGEPWFVYHTDEVFYHWNVGNNMFVEEGGNRYKLQVTKQPKALLSKSCSDPLKRLRYEEN